MDQPPPTPTPTTSTTPQKQPPQDNPLLTSLQHYHTTRSLPSPIYTYLLGPATAPLITFTSATPSSFTARLVLRPHHLNSSGSLHGSVSATLVDWAGGLAIAAAWGGGEAAGHGTGVSVDIHVAYLAGARLGETVEIEGRAEKVGGSLGFTEVRIFRVGEDGERGEVLVSGRHTKFVRGAVRKMAEGKGKGEGEGA